MKFTTPKKLNISVHPRIKKALFALLIVVGVLVLIYPFYPQPYTDVYYKAYSMLNKYNSSGGNSGHNVILRTPGYVLVGTQEERLAYVNASTSGLNTLRSLDSNSQGNAVSVQGDTKPAGQLVIKKIGVNMPISTLPDPAQALAIGAQLIPGTATPDQFSNTAIAGHRFQYLPPSSKTLYLLHKLEQGDDIVVHWNNRTYTYRMLSSKEVLPDDISVLYATSSPRLTLITCTPIFSTAKRLIVTANLVSVD